MAAEGGDVERRGPEQGPAEGSNDMDGPSTADAAAGPAFDLPFARLRPPFTFYQDALMLTLLGAALGAFGYAYLQSITQSNDAWLRADGRAAYPQPSTLGWGSGRPWYVGLCAGTGLAVGLTKVVLRLDRAPSFITGGWAGSAHAVPTPARACAVRSFPLPAERCPRRPPNAHAELQALPSDAEHGWMALKVGVCCLMSLLGGMPMG